MEVTRSKTSAAVSLSRKRISRSLVTVVVMGLFNSAFAPSNFLPSASAAIVTTGTCSVDGTNMSSSNIIDSTGSDGTCTIRLTSGTSSFLVPTGINTVAALVVSGGGGGGFGGNGGGGGAGAVISSDSGVPATPGTTISGTVGGGGTSGYVSASESTWTKGGKGIDSSLTINLLQYVASGGGGGSAFGTNADNGGSGGGKAINGNGPGNGFNFDYAGWTERVFSGASHSGVGGGGGGGAGGSPATNSSNGAVGVTIFGYSVGGGGSGWQGGSATAAAPFGGGAPRQGTAASGCVSCNGTANTGGGGGGGGAGGSGVIVVKFVQSRGQGTIVQTNGFQINRTSTFTFTRTGAVPTSTSVTYQWQVKPAGSSTWSNVTTGTGGTTLTYQTPILSASDNGNTYRIGVTDTQSTYGISTTTFTETSVQTLFTPPGSDTDTGLILNGTSQFADVADTTGSVFDMTGTFTLQAWVKPANACPGEGAVISKNVSYMLYCQAGLWKVMTLANGTTGTGDPTSISVEPNEWHHIAISKISTSRNILFYYDGVLVQTIVTAANVLTMTPNNNPFQIGQYTGSYFFNGQIDQVNVYNTQRTQTQIAADMNAYGLITDSALMAYYDFNEGPGASTLYNRKSGATSATDLTIRNSPTFTDVKTVTTSGPYTVMNFPRTYINQSGGWRSPVSITAVNYLIAAGGGAGGRGDPNAHEAGGGGAGGVLTGVSAIAPNTLYPILVGVGGVGIGANPAAGGNSSALSLTTIGGGFGAFGTGVGGGGGSGGGGTHNQTAGGAGTAGQGTSGVTPSRASSGGGGGGATASGVNGVGGLGLSSSITGTPIVYGDGGGVGLFSAASGGIFGSQGGSGNGGRGATSFQQIPGDGIANTGSGGGGAYASTTTFKGGNGGSGVIIIRWITAPRPIFTQPLIDTTTAGLTDTITVSANPISPLTRNFQWQSSTDTGTTWSNIASNSGSGALTNTYTTPILETTTSGARFQYRVIVTDSDTAGLFIVDTSVAVFIVINPRITFSGTFTPQKYGEGDSDTFTVLNGTGNKTVVRTSSNRAGVSWDFNTLNTAVVNVAPTVSVGTYLETITATDTRGAQTQLVISVVVTKADTITVTALSRGDTFTGSALTFTPSFTVTGLKNSDTVTPVIYNFSGADNAGANYASSTTRPINAGSYIITPSVPASLTDSYTAVTIVTGALTINRATRTLAVTAPASPLKYGETRTITSTLSAGAGDGALTYLTSTPDSCTVSSTTVQAVRASGSCSFTAQITRGNNFETATASAATTTLARADTITVQLRNPVTLTYTANPASSLPTQTIIGLVHTDAATTTRLYSHPASAVGAPESYAALTNSAIVPTDVESYTVSSSTLNFSSGLASNYVNIVYETSTLRINQANQVPLRIAIFGAFVGGAYPINTDGGSGSGAILESVTAGGSASGCSISNRLLTMTSTVQSFCNILVTKAATRNFLRESATAQITFYLYVMVSPAPEVGSGSGIALNSINVVTVDPNRAPEITSFSPSSISLAAGGTLTISGFGFGTAQLVVNFGRGRTVQATSTDGQTLLIPISAISAANGITARISITTSDDKSAVSTQILTITP